MRSGKIRRGLQINAEGHGGLEKYHLALLQYLIKGDAYRASHVYVDEFSARYRDFAFGHPLPHDEGLLLSLRPPAPRAGETPEVVEAPPEYRLRWNLAADPKRDDGVIFMATLNPETSIGSERSGRCGGRSVRGRRVVGRLRGSLSRGGRRGLPRGTADHRGV